MELKTVSFASFCENIQNNLLFDVVVYLLTSVKMCINVKKSN